jgi:protein AroM
MALRTPLIESQIVVDETVAALAGSIGDLGILVPHREQADSFHPIAAPGRRVHFSHASPYGEVRFDAAGRELADTELIVMHCMGYSEPMRRAVAAASGRPVLLAREIVGRAIREFTEFQEAEAPRAGAAPQ